MPYRNHKLTMLMQAGPDSPSHLDSKDSLGGSAKTLMFVNCSPASSNAEETLTSLKWATRAKQVTNDVKRIDLSFGVGMASGPFGGHLILVVEHNAFRRS